MLDWLLFKSHHFLQKPRESSVINEKSSNLPSSMSNISIHLSNNEKLTYELPGPTEPIPVPTLPKVATEAPTAVSKSEPV